MDYDVIVCGAGPAGATCAKFVSEKGYKVALLEKTGFPRDKPCGGVLRISIDEHKFVMDGMKSISLTESREVKMHSPSKGNVVSFRDKDPLMLHMRRTEFDPMLVDKAVDAGATLLEDHNVTKVAPSAGKAVVSVKGGKKLASHLIVGAGGVHDPVAGYLRKKHKLPPKWEKKQLAFLVTTETPVKEDFIKKTFGPRRTSHMFLRPSGVKGYAWLFPKKDVLNTGFGAFWGDMKNIDIKKEYNEFIRSLKKQKLFPKDVKTGKLSSGELPMAGPLKRTYTDRMLIIGDAAGFVSPLIGDGLYYAISSGRFAADTLVKALKNERYDSPQLREYQVRWKKAWGREFLALGLISRSVDMQTERFTRYVARDHQLRQQAQGVLSGRDDPFKMMVKATPRMMLDMLRYR